jgi:hypothetical protein
MRFIVTVIVTFPLIAICCNCGGDSSSDRNPNPNQNPAPSSSAATADEDAAREAARQAAAPDAAPPAVSCDYADVQNAPSTSQTGVHSLEKLGCLKPVQKETICDWLGKSVGGYGSDSKCRTFSSAWWSRSHADCIASLAPWCETRIQELEACVIREAGSECGTAISRRPDCASLRACLGIPTS